MADKITDEIIVEVTGVDAKNEHLSGYAKPATKYTSLTLSSGGAAYQSMRHAQVQIPGDVPIGTRFRIRIEQIDDVTPATIIRGAIPNVIEAAPQLAEAPAPTDKDVLVTDAHNIP